MVVYGLTMDNDSSFFAADGQNFKSNNFINDNIMQESGSNNNRQRSNVTDNSPVTMESPDYSGNCAVFNDGAVSYDTTQDTQCVTPLMTSPFNDNDCMENIVTNSIQEIEIGISDVSLAVPLTSPDLSTVAQVSTINIKTEKNDNLDCSMSQSDNKSIETNANNTANKPYTVNTEHTNTDEKSSNVDTDSVSIMETFQTRLLKLHFGSDDPHQMQLGINASINKLTVIKNKVDNDISISVPETVELIMSKYYALLLAQMRLTNNNTAINNRFREIDMALQRRNITIDIVKEIFNDVLVFWKLWFKTWQSKNTAILMQIETTENTTSLKVLNKTFI